MGLQLECLTTRYLKFDEYLPFSETLLKVFTIALNELP